MADIEETLRPVNRGRRGGILRQHETRVSSLAFDWYAPEFGLFPFGKGNR